MKYQNSPPAVDQLQLWTNTLLTSSSVSFLKHKHAALLLNPSPSYVLVWFGLNFIIYIRNRWIPGKRPKNVGKGVNLESAES